MSTVSRRPYRHRLITATQNKTAIHFEPDPDSLTHDGLCQISFSTLERELDLCPRAVIETSMPYDVDKPAVRMTIPVDSNFNQLKNLALGLYFSLVEIETGVAASNSARMEFMSELFSAADRASENYHITAKNEEKQREKNRRKKKNHE